MSPPELGVPLVHVGKRWPKARIASVHITNLGSKRMVKEISKMHLPTLCELGLKLLTVDSSGDRPEPYTLTVGKDTIELNNKIF